MILRKTIKHYVKEMWRWPLRKRMRGALRNREFSLITANCVGGILSHDVGEQFRSPTIKLIIPDFVTFCENLERYLNEISMIPRGFTGQGYPVCMLDELEIIGVHYSCHEELINCWNRRKTRVNFNCIFLMATDSFINSQEKAIRFDALPWPKVCFTAKPNCEYGWYIVLSFRRTRKWEIY